MAPNGEFLFPDNTHVGVAEDVGMTTTTYTASPHCPSGGYRTSPTLFTARQQPELGFLCTHIVYVSTCMSDTNVHSLKKIQIYFYTCSADFSKSDNETAHSSLTV